MWPKLVFTDPSAHGPSVPYTAARLAYSIEVPDRYAGSVRLDETDRGGVDPGGGQGALVDGDLRRLRWRRDVHGAAILIGGGAAQDREDAIAIAFGIGQTLEEQHTQPSPDTNPSAAASNA